MKKILILSCLFLYILNAQEKEYDKYISANLNLLGGQYTSINYGNIKNGFEFNYRTNINYQSSDFAYDYIKESVAFASIRKLFKKSKIGMLTKNNYIGLGVGYTFSERKQGTVYSANPNMSLKSEMLLIDLSYGSKLIYKINNQAAIEIHLPFITLKSTYNLYSIDPDGNADDRWFGYSSSNERLKYSFLIASNMLINVRFYF